jgi:dihydrolipoamide dehydrogenase
MAESFDTIVIGSGPGGYVAAIRSAQLGLRTVVIERDDVVGGRCLNYACIPAKAVLRSADILSEVREAGEYGINLNGTEPTVDFGAIGERRKKVIGTLTGGVAGLFKKNNIEVISGEASLTADGDVKVGDTVYKAEKAVILATGSVKKPLPGLDFGGNVIGTEEAWALTELPATMVVIGAGASARRSPSTRAWTACCRPRTPTSPRPPRAASRSRGSRSRSAPSTKARRPTGSSSPPAAGQMLQHLV